MFAFFAVPALFCCGGCVYLGYKISPYVQPSLSICVRLAALTYVGCVLAPVVKPAAGFAYGQLSVLLKAIKGKLQNSTCRTVDKSRIYINTWIIERFTMRRTELKSAYFSGRTYDGQRVTWEYLLDTRNERVLKLKILSSVVLEPYVLVEVEHPFNTLFSGFFGSVNIELARSSALRYLNQDGSLTFRIKVTFLDTFGYCSLEGTIPHPDSSRCSLVQTFANLLSSMQFSDITVRVGQRTFQAHKCVFAARSRVFAAMFQHDMQDSQRNEIIIPNMDPEVFEEVLRFIYTDNAEGLPRMAFELLEAAEKYNLARLKALCVMELRTGITAESATKTLVFADLYQAVELKAQVLKFIAKNATKIPNWMEFCNDRPDLVAEIFAEPHT